MPLVLWPSNPGCNTALPSCRLSPQGPVMQEEIATHAGVFVPTNIEAAWVLPDESRWVYAQMTVSKVTARI